MKDSFPTQTGAVVATVTQSEDLDFIKQGDLQTDILEFRLDSLSKEIESVIACQSEQIKRHGILSTARCPGEGGQSNLSLEKRLALLEQSLPHSHFVDLEIATLSSEAEARKFAAKAQSLGVQIVASFHDFEKCPSPSNILSQLDSAFDLGADIGKLAVVVNTFPELNHLIEIVENQIDQGRQISAMGMGPLGKLSRLVLSKAGSCLNYGYLQKPNAPGQWSAAELQDLIQKIES